MKTNNIKCQFCQEGLIFDHPSNGVYYCDKHWHTRITYVFGGSEQNPIPWETVFIVPQMPVEPATVWTYYHLILHHQTKKTYLNYYGDRANPKFQSPSEIATLNYLLDVNPQNVQDWIDKILNLKVFS